MNRHQKTKVVAIRSLAAAASIIIGVLVTAQWRSIPERITNPIAPYTSLKETKEALYEEQNQLKTEMSKLQNDITEAQKEISKTVLTEAEQEDLGRKKAQAGLYKVKGAGVIVIYDDSQKGALSDESIVHAADLRDTINLLWASGAEAIAINSQRLVINSAIDCIVNTILVNNTRITNPFRIEAIGNQDLMTGKIADKKILKNIHRRRDEEGLIFEVKKNDDITLPIFDGSFETKGGEL